MEYSENDRMALYDLWMSQKVKMRMTQMEMAKKLGVTQGEFSARLRGELPLTRDFVDQFCARMRVRPEVIIPSVGVAAGVRHDSPLTSKISIEGSIVNVEVIGSELIVQYYPPSLESTR
uniref:helix-turn-helix domain-containing protein n=1 Tax=Thaumasiovibrio occultus TaxID=1891184 RepID=UPI000B35165E|nr:helix-turn-helix transcriptional regulator [Thaumasiovibrio occultus]